MDKIFDLKGKRVFVAGHRGMVGSALVRRLASEDCEILTVARSELDLLDQAGVRRWMADRRPDAVVMAAAKVGGILANDSLPVDFLYENLVVQNNVIEAAFRNEVRKLLFLGSSCIYPKLAPQPMNQSLHRTESDSQPLGHACVGNIRLLAVEKRRQGFKRGGLSVLNEVHSDNLKCTIQDNASPPRIK